MDDDEALAAQFEEHRGRLRAVAYRMLGSFGEADDAVQEAWLRVSRAGIRDVEDLAAWLTTVVARICLNMLRSRGRRREDPLESHLPDPVVSPDVSGQPEDQAVLADSVSLAMLVVLDTLGPDERLAFVLHDMFGVSFDEIAPLVGRSTAAARQLASRARRRVQGSQVTDAEPDRGRQRVAVDAFFRAARNGEFDALVAVLHPDVELHSDFGRRRPPAPLLVRGADAVAGSSLRFAIPNADLVPALVAGQAGVVVTVGGRPVSILSFTVAAGRVVRIDAIADPDRVRRIAADVVRSGDRPT